MVFCWNCFRHFCEVLQLIQAKSIFFICDVGILKIYKILNIEKKSKYNYETRFTTSIKALLKYVTLRQTNINTIALGTYNIPALPLLSPKGSTIPSPLQIPTHATAITSRIKIVLWQIFIE